MEVAKVGMRCRLIVYSYLDVHDILDKITYLSKRDAREIQDSGIASKGKIWECQMFERDYHYEVAHPYSVS